MAALESPACLPRTPLSWPTPTLFVTGFSIGVLLNVVCVPALPELRRIVEQLFNETLFLKSWCSCREGGTETIAAFLPAAVCTLQIPSVRNLVFFISLTLWGGETWNSLLFPLFCFLCRPGKLPRFLLSVLTACRNVQQAP